ncbi:MAG: IS21 family transposase, partial [Cyanobacteria bacterium Co-bin8]|nr:IS21 family transposase [Cyanobacteria bacterium Co-bin8]
MSGQYIQRYQVHVYKRARSLGCSQENSAQIAGFSGRSGSRIERGEHQLKSKGQREWRTREDPLSGVWERELEPMLRREPRLEAMTLYEHLVEHYPGQYEQTLRTVQRRVQAWKAIYGEAQEVMFELQHVPGGMGLSDFTELKQVTITIGGKPFEHLLYHYRLAYSGWQYVQVIQGGESFIGLSEGLQNALRACGGAPKQHRTDSLSAAYRNMAGKGRKPLTQFYEELCAHYNLQPTRNNTGIAHENGSIESSHGYFK